MPTVDPVWLALAWGIGWVLKNKTDWSNQAIPVLNIALQFLGRIMLEIKPAEASVFSDVLSGAKNILIESAYTTLLATGFHSGGKASGRFFLNILKKVVLNRLSEEKDR